MTLVPWGRNQKLIVMWFRGVQAVAVGRDEVVVVSANSTPPPTAPAASVLPDVVLEVERIAGALAGRLGEVRVPVPCALAQVVHGAWPASHRWCPSGCRRWVSRNRGKGSSGWCRKASESGPRPAGAARRNRAVRLRRGGASCRPRAVKRMSGRRAAPGSRARSRPARTPAGAETRSGVVPTGLGCTVNGGSGNASPDRTSPPPPRRERRRRWPVRKTRERGVACVASPVPPRCLSPAPAARPGICGGPRELDRPLPCTRGAPAGNL